MKKREIREKKRKGKGKKVINQFRKFKLKLTRTDTRRVDQKFILGFKLFRAHRIPFLIQMDFRLQAVFLGFALCRSILLRQQL